MTTHSDRDKRRASRAEQPADDWESTTDVHAVLPPSTLDRPATQADVKLVWTHADRNAERNRGRISELRNDFIAAEARGDETARRVANVQLQQADMQRSLTAIQLDMGAIKTSTSHQDDGRKELRQWMRIATTAFVAGMVAISLALAKGCVDQQRELGRISSDISALQKAIESKGDSK